MAVDFGIKAVDKDEWRNLTSLYVDHNYRQLFEYSESAAELIGADSEFVAIHEGQELKGLANVRIKKIPYLTTGVAYINGGPLVNNRGRLGEGDLVESLAGCLLALKHEYVERRGLVLRIVCPVNKHAINVALAEVFEQVGFNRVNSKGSYRTILIDIAFPLDLIRKNLAQKWRNVLNKAEKNGLVIIRGAEIDLFDQFQVLFNNLVERKKIQVDLGPIFFRDIQNSLTENEKFIVHMALLEGQPVAGHIGSYLGDTAVYLLGAANDDGLKSNASYLLQWSVIQYAHNVGCKWYDLGGIDPESNPDVYRFKQRMGGEDVSSAGPYEASTFVTGLLVHLAEYIYNLIKALR